MRKPLTVTPLFAIAALLFISAAQPQTPAWKPLFNGKDLTGWKHVGPGNMTVEDGLIRTHGGMPSLLDWRQALQLPHPRGLQDARLKR